MTHPESPEEPQACAEVAEEIKAAEEEGAVFRLAIRRAIGRLGAFQGELDKKREGGAT